jgi:hypothetical protein
MLGYAGGRERLRKGLPLCLCLQLRHLCKHLGIHLLLLQLQLLLLEQQQLLLCLQLSLELRLGLRLQGKSGMTCSVRSNICRMHAVPEKASSA